MDDTQPNRYPFPMRLLHHFMACCIMGALILGFYPEVMPKGWGAEGWRLHKSLGVTILLLLPLRVWFRQKSILPPPVGTSTFEHSAAKIVHHLLYLSMLLMAGSGYVMIAAKGKTILWFGMPLPAILPLNPDLAAFVRQYHEPFAYFLLSLLALHLLALLKHRWVNHTNLLPRMF